MSMLSSRLRCAARAGVCLALIAICAAPAAAGRWPGDLASPGGALAARAIGQACRDVLDAAALAELDLFLARARTEWQADTTRSGKAAIYDEFTAKLADDYAARYRDGTACDADATEEARDMHGRVQRSLASGRPVLPNRNDPARRPDIDEAIEAKVTAMQCAAVSADDWALLEVYVARSYLGLARMTSQGDAREVLLSFKRAEAILVEGWQPSQCEGAAVEAARTVATLARKALADGPN